MKTTIEVKDFRNALGQFPTGVTVITALDKNQEPIGVTASSFNSVSMDPPLVLWSVAKSAYSAEIFKTAKHFIVNVLSENQIDISNACARQGEDKFASISYDSGIDDCPVLQNTAAFFECKTWNLYEGGDHIIVVGEVVNYAHNVAIKPLVFAQGAYSKSIPHSIT